MAAPKWQALSRPRTESRRMSNFVHPRTLLFFVCFDQLREALEQRDQERAAREAVEESLRRILTGRAT